MAHSRRSTNIISPLGSNPGSKFTLVYSNRVTIDFTKPFDEQIRRSHPNDRNAQVTKWPFEEPDDERKSERRRLASDLATYLMEFVSEREGEPDIVGEFGQRFLDLMKDEGDPMFQHVYYEPAGGKLDGPDPLVGLDEAIYSLRQDVGADSGLRAGFEEWVLEWGPLGNNGKGPAHDMHAKQYRVVATSREQQQW